MEERRGYRLEIDRSRKLLILTVLTMRSPEHSAWAGEALPAAIQSFGPDIGQHVTLYNGSAIQSLPTATVNHILQTLNHPAVRAIWARKVAFVVTTASARGCRSSGCSRCVRISRCSTRARRRLPGWWRPEREHRAPNLGRFTAVCPELVEGARPTKWYAVLRQAQHKRTRA
jgi:hypothetical protein